MDVLTRADFVRDFKAKSLIWRDARDIAKEVFTEWLRSIHIDGVSVTAHELFLKPEPGKNRDPDEDDRIVVTFENDATGQRLAVQITDNYLADLHGVPVLFGGGQDGVREALNRIAREALAGIKNPASFRQRGTEAL